MPASNDEAYDHVHRWMPHEHFKLIASTDVLDFSSVFEEPTKISQIVVFSPGNPGIVSFYERFLLDMQERLRSSGVLVLGIGHLGHNIVHHVPFAHYHTDIEEICESKIMVLKTLLQSCITTGRFTFEDNVKVHLLSHSMGCYVILKILQPIRDLLDHLSGLSEFPSFQLSSNIMLHPAIQEIEDGCNQMLRIASGARMKRFSTWIAKSVLKTTPYHWKLKLAVKALSEVHELGPTTAYNQHSISVTAALLNQPRAIANLLHLLHIEIQIIRQFPEELISAALDCCTNRFLFSESDRWATLTHKDRIDALLKRRKDNNSSTVMASDWLGINIPHQFCSHDVASTRLAEVLTQFLLNDERPC